MEFNKYGLSIDFNGRFGEIIGIYHIQIGFDKGFGFFRTYYDEWHNNLKLGIVYIYWNSYK